MAPPNIYSPESREQSNSGVSGLLRRYREFERQYEEATSYPSLYNNDRPGYRSGLTMLSGPQDVLPPPLLPQAAYNEAQVNQVPPAHHSNAPIPRTGPRPPSHRAHRVTGHGPSQHRQAPTLGHPTGDPVAQHQVPQITETSDRISIREDTTFQQQEIELPYARMPPGDTLRQSSVDPTPLYARHSVPPHPNSGGPSANPHAPTAAGSNAPAANPAYLFDRRLQLHQQLHRQQQRQLMGYTGGTREVEPVMTDQERDYQEALNELVSPERQLCNGWRAGEEPFQDWGTPEEDDSVKGTTGEDDSGAEST